MVPHHRPARHYSRFWIWCPSSEHQRDFNPPDQCAARRTLWANLTPDCLWLSYLIFRFAYLPCGRNFRASQVLVRFSRHMPRSLWTPADPRKAHQCAFSVLTSGPLKPSSSALGGLHHRRNLRGYIKTSGSADFLVAYVVPCVRFNDVVRSLMSEICVPAMQAR